VTSESAMLLKVRTCDSQSLEYLFERIHAIEGFKGTRSYIALSTYLERGPNPQVASYIALEERAFLSARLIRSRRLCCHSRRSPVARTATND
jgi:hypothetical protein